VSALPVSCSVSACIQDRHADAVYVNNMRQRRRGKRGGQISTGEIPVNPSLAANKPTAKRRVVID
jgi:hypothetical protein